MSREQPISFDEILETLDGRPSFPGADPLSEALAGLARLCDVYEPDRAPESYAFRCFALDLPSGLPPSLPERLSAAHPHLASQLHIHIPVPDPRALILRPWAPEQVDLTERLARWFFRPRRLPQRGRLEALSRVQALLRARLGDPYRFAPAELLSPDPAWGDEAEAFVALGQRAALFHLALWHDEAAPL